MILAMFGEANDSSIWGASWFLCWVVVGGFVNCWDVLFCSDRVYHYQSLGMMSVFVLIGYEIGPEMVLRIRISFGIEHIQMVHSYSRKYCTLYMIAMLDFPANHVCLPEDTPRVPLPWTTMAATKTPCHPNPSRGHIFETTLFDSNKYPNFLSFFLWPPATFFHGKNLSTRSSAGGEFYHSSRWSLFETKACTEAWTL